MLGAVDPDAARRVARDILADRRFHPGHGPRPFAGFFRRVGELLVDPVLRFFRAIGPPPRPTWSPPGPPGPPSWRPPAPPPVSGDEPGPGPPARSTPPHRRRPAMTPAVGTEGDIELDPVALARRRATRLSIVAGVGFLALAALSSLLPGGGGQGGGSPSSSYSNRPDGAAAWAELLSRFGHHVDRLRGELDSSTLDPGATVVVLDAPGLTGREARDLGHFVRLGGRLVAGGAGAGNWLESVIDDAPKAAGRGTRTAGPVGAPPAPEVDGVGTVRTAQLGSWRDPGGLEPILAGDGGRVIAVAGDSERGRIVALADPSPVQNALLAVDDNAALALGLAGGAGRTVLFAEGAHGYGRGEGLAALPRRWRLTLA